jgi:DNA-directed RNA polymerase specialized sigma subunit
LLDPAHVVRALTSFTDSERPVSSSVLSVGSGRRSSDLLGFGALARVEERAELTRRLKRLPERERLLLLLWYAEGWPAIAIAEHLGISRIHCYRLRNRAIEALTCPTDALDQRAQPSAAGA